jgi:hypothetical protein
MSDSCPICGHDLAPAGKLLNSAAAAMRIHLSTHLSDILEEFGQFVFKTGVQFDDPNLTDQEKTDFKQYIRATLEKYRDIQLAFDKQVVR